MKEVKRKSEMRKYVMDFLHANKPAESYISNYCLEL